MHLTEKFISLVSRRHTAVLIVIAVITVFFAASIPKIHINANVFSIGVKVDSSEFVKTPDSKPSSPLFLDRIGTVSINPERGEVTDIPERRMPGIDIPPADGTDYIVSFEPSLIPHDPEYNPGYPDGYVIIFSSDRLFDKDTLNRIYEVREELSKRWEIGPCLSPFDYVTVEKKGTRLAMVPISPVPAGGTWTDEDVEIFKNRLLNDSVAGNYLCSEDGSAIMIYYRARGLSHAAITELNEISNALREYGHVALSGGGLISDAVLRYLNRDLFLLALLAFLVILAVYYLSFRSIKAMLIPASMSVLAIVWTIGAMARLGYDLTIVTVLTPCLVLTLGSSYSIHMISEYVSAVLSGDTDNLGSHYEKTVRTIFLAMLTTVFGFLSFLICRTSLFRDFGITVSIGVFFCFVLSFTYIPAILSTRAGKITVRNGKKYRSGILARFISTSSDFIVRRFYIPIIILFAVIIVFSFIKDDIAFENNYMNYFPKSSVISQDSYFFARTFGGTNPYYFTIDAPEGSDKFFLKHENLEQVYAYEAAVLAACPDIVQILSFPRYVSFLNEVYSGTEGIPQNNGIINLLSRTLTQIGNNIGMNVLDMLISDDGNSITLSMRNYDSAEGDLQTISSERRVEKTLDYYRYMLPEGTESRIWCGESDNIKAIDIVMSDQVKATILSLLLIFIVAAIAFKSPAYGLLVLIPISFGVMVNYVFMFAFGISFDLVTVGFSSIAMGAGVDDSIHFLLRYRMKKKERPKEKMRVLIRENLNGTGRPIILTTLSVDAGLITLLFASFIPVKYFGAMMCVSLMGAMLATLFVLPSVMLLFDRIKARVKK